MNLSLKFWSYKFTSKFSPFQQNSPTVFLDVYRIFLSSVSKEEQAKNQPWVFSRRFDLNEAGSEDGVPVLELILILVHALPPGGVHLHVTLRWGEIFSLHYNHSDGRKG